MPSRLNITIRDVAKGLVESVRLYISRAKRRGLEVELKAGYSATATESAEISKDFEPTVSDGIN